MSRNVLFRSTAASIVILAALIPSARLAWLARDMPMFGGMSDDGIYMVGAKSLAQGTGYRILHLPGQPFQTKFPPLFSWLLALVWKIDPRFPSNLSLAAALVWLLLPVMAALAWLFFRDIGFGVLHRSILCAVILTGSFFVLMSLFLLSDFLFTALLLGSLLLAERASKPGSGIGLAAAAGILAALAYLTRTAALPLLITAPVCFLLRKQLKQAIAFVVCMAPAVFSWTLWTGTHRMHATDALSFYQTDYLGYRFYALSSSELPFMIWKNMGAMLGAIRGLLIFDDRSPFWWLLFSAVVSCFCIAGAVRISRRRRLLQYPLFACAYLLILLVWHYPPEERFLVPLFPLFLAGLSVELERLRPMIATSLVSPSYLNRAVAALLATGLIGVLCLAAQTRWVALFADFPELVAAERNRIADGRLAYQWISSNLPADAAFLCGREALVFLYTGRQAASQPRPANAVYRGIDRDAYISIDSSAEFAVQQGLTYLYLERFEFSSDLMAKLRLSRQFRQVYSLREFRILQLQNPVPVRLVRR